LSITAMPVENQILQSLSFREHRRLVGCCTPVELSFGDVLCDAGQPFRHAYFPVTALVSLVIAVDHHQSLEMGMIGNEGMLGASLALGLVLVPLRGVVQGPGVALRIPAVDLRRELDANPPLRRAANKYLYLLMQQLAQTAACNSFHEGEARLSRWLLMTHDRVHMDTFNLTHQFLADMLGLQRSAVTIAAGALQDKALISYSRGKISITDRAGLEAAACVCYSRDAENYQRLFG